VDYRKFDIQLRIGGSAARVELTVPNAPMSLPEFLPIVHALTEIVVQAAEREVGQAGRVVSCGPRCGACCRQLVPIATAEAAALRDVIASLESSHRKRVKERFSAAGERLKSTGLAGRLQGRSARRDKASRLTQGLEYFALGIACPFLEDESCSIHDQRPLACREYLVTSDPSACRQPDARSVETVEMPNRMSLIFRGFAADFLQRDSGWTPLISVLDDSSLDLAAIDAVRLPGPLLMERFLAAMASPAAKATAPESPTYQTR
jgi:Fe-S-cluster containining protein